MVSSPNYRYAELANSIENQIRHGAFRVGEKLPSIRSLHLQTGLSISTVYQAFIELEKRGMVEPRQKSGYYVKPLIRGLLPPPQPPAITHKPKKVKINNLAFALIESIRDPDILQLGGALIDATLAPPKEIVSIIKTAPIKLLKTNLACYEHYLGHFELRRQISKRMAAFCGSVTANAIVITNGCLEAVALSLKSITKSGDTILVESPTFPWFLQIIEDLNLNALEIPTDPQEGIDLAALEKATRLHNVKACIFIANFHNPLGFLMTNDKKKALVNFLNKHKIPIIEDDIYGELYFGPTRPQPLKAFDHEGLVLYCASFSKSIAPGFRTGWVQPGKFFEHVIRYKMNQNICGPGLTQWALARYLQSGHYDRHLRKLRTQLKNQISNTALAIARYFPKNTKISAPQGGLTLWVQLDPNIDSLQLFHRALEKKIAILPGIICANNNNYKNCLRISCGMPYTEKIDIGLQTLAAIIRNMAPRSSQ